MSTFWEGRTGGLDYHALIKRIETGKIDGLSIEWNNDDEPVITDGENYLHLRPLGPSGFGLKRFGMNDPEPIQKKLKEHIDSLELVHEENLDYTHIF